jgi:hypothetical protein
MGKIIMLKCSVGRGLAAFSHFKMERCEFSTSRTKDLCRYRAVRTSEMAAVGEREARWCKNGDLSAWQHQN